MRYQTFMRRVVGESVPEVCTFGPDHFREAGVSYGTLAGLPQLEAHQLINRWNRNQFETCFVYWLEA